MSDKIFSQIGGFDFTLIKNKAEQLTNSIKKNGLVLQKLSQSSNLDSSEIKNELSIIYNEFVQIEDLIIKINFDLDAAAPQANLNSDITNKLKKDFLEQLKII